MKYTGEIRATDLYDNGHVSGWYQQKTFNSKREAWKWLKRYVASLGEDGYACCVFTKPYSYSKRMTDEGPDWCYEEIICPYFYLGTRYKNQKIFY